MKMTIEFVIELRWYDQRISFKNLKKAKDLNYIDVSYSKI